MAQTQAEIQLPDAVTQNSWDGISAFRIADYNGGQPPYPLEYAKIQFRMNSDSAPAKLTLDTDGNGLVITDAADWEFSVNEVKRLPLEPGRWYFDIRCIDTQNTCKTYVRGWLNVLPAYTKGGIK